jgi:hypothetical protein
VANDVPASEAWKKHEAEIHLNINDEFNDEKSNDLEEMQ